MSIKKIGVIGAGMMGAEIALCFAKAGFEVTLSDIKLEYTEKGKNRIADILDKNIARGKFPEDEKSKVMGRVSLSETLDQMAECDFIVEAAKEDLEIKSDIYKQLQAVCKSECIIASNTSSISITKLASALSEERSTKFIGTHFNSPASVMKLVEVIPGLLTDEETTQTTIQLLTEIGKEAVKVKDVVGFGLNRLFHAFVVEACRLVEEGVCSVEDVDKICLYGLGHPMGVFKLLDHTGHDLNLAVEKIMFDAYGERFRPNATLQRMVDSNRLGRKTGRGFYDYTNK